jgi:hypothetical protein
MFLHRLTIFAVLIATGCSHESKEVILARNVYWMAPDGGLPAYAGKLTPTEVEHLRAEIKKISFPVKEGVFQKLIPADLKAKIVLNWDHMSGDAQGRVGGIVEDYWLNTSSILRVATAYYSVGGEHYNCQDWAEVIDPEHAYTDDPRGPRK